MKATCLHPPRCDQDLGRRRRYRHWLHGIGGIEVARTHDAGKIRIKARSVRSSDEFLNHHRHLLLFETERRGVNVGLGVLGEGGSVNALDRFVEFLKTVLSSGSRLASMNVS